MSHITIIISKVPTPSEAEAETSEVSYEYVIPVPHGTSAAEAGKMVRKALCRLEGADLEQNGE